MDSASKRATVDAARQDSPIESLVFDLHVLCPSFPEPLIVRNVTTTATIGELRQRIQRLLISLGVRWITGSDVRMRLIYRGRLLTDDDATMLSVFGEQQMRSSTGHTVHLAIYAPDSSSSSSSLAQPAAAAADPSAALPRPAPAVRSSPMLTEAEMQRRIQAHFQQRSLTPQHMPAPVSRPTPGSGPAFVPSHPVAIPSEQRTQEAVNIIASAMQRSLSGMGGPLPSYSGAQQPNPDPLFAHTPFRIHTPQLTEAVSQPTPKMYVLQAPDGRAHSIIVDTSNIKAPVPFNQPSAHQSHAHINAFTQIQPPIPTPTTPAMFAAAAAAATPNLNQNPVPNPEAPANNVNVAVRINAIALDPENPDRPLWLQFLRLLWSEVWFILRLIIFVWWFAGGTNDPFRWAGALSLAAVFIALNVGLFEDFGRLFRANIIGGLMPRIDAHGRPAAAAAAAAAPTANVTPLAGQPAGDIPGDPQVLANRLYRRAQEGQATWLLNLARSLERGFMMFMASLAPGLAEGHIANVEAAEERRRQAERRRAEEEETKKRQEEEERARAEKGEADAAAGSSGDADVKDKETLGVASGAEAVVENAANAAAAAAAAAAADSAADIVD